MTQFLIIGNGDGSIERYASIINHVHSQYDTADSAIEMKNRLNKAKTGLTYHIEEWLFTFSAECVGHTVIKKIV